LDIHRFPRHPDLRSRRSVKDVSRRFVKDVMGLNTKLGRGF